MGMTRQDKLDLVEKFGAAAKASQQKYGVPASITIAQAILESGWGESQLAKQCNNFFGIKDVDHESYQEFPTTEYSKGRKTRELARFEKYPSFESCFAAHARLLSIADRYQPAMAADNPRSFALQLLACGYSTDPSYPDKLIALVRQYALTRFDAPPAQGAKI